MINIGLGVPRSGIAHNMEEANAVLAEVGLPCIIRPAYTLGGTGSGIAFNQQEFNRITAYGIECSRVNEVLIEQSVIGWKEYEMEVMRDRKDNVVIICSIENFDAMGVHTGDSITVAPAQTLTDKEYQRMRDASLAVMREIGVETGGSNIQYAINPDNGDMIVIEMNPRVSRSSALASKATGFPIAKFAAKLAVGYTLDEIPNDITRETPASFEPTIDYCVVKIPRFTFEKFPLADGMLTSQMKSVGETMSIGRTFKESLQKAIRGLEISRFGLGLDRKDEVMNGGLPDIESIRQKLITPNADRIFYLRYAFLAGMSLDEIFEHSKIDRWFLENMIEIVAFEETLRATSELDEVPREVLLEAKRLGYADEQLAHLWQTKGSTVREHRKGLNVTPSYKLVDTCAAEFEAHTPYLYSTYERECEARPSDRRKVVILGGGPNRIGQGIEFDYCCVHAAFALTDAGFETIMVNCNPETVSTDYDTSDRLYFEPLTLEDVIEVVECEKPEGLIVQFGGQTPLRLAVALEQAGVPILGTTPDAIDRAEDRERFDALLETLQLRRPPGQVARSSEEAEAVAERIGYPVLVRPSYVLGGRAMEIVHDAESLRRYMHFAVQASPEHPVLVDRFLADATEVDVDAVCDGERVVIGGIMEHIEQAGVHSGDSACSLPPYSLSLSVVDEISASTRKLALELGVLGLVNIQYAVKRGEVFVIEVNPRASRTVPFVSKAIGRPLAKIAALVMVGKSLAELDFTEEIWPRHYSVKEAVFPFVKFPGADTLLGPEMKSTGEVMGIDSEFGRAYAKAQIEAGNRPPISGTVFVSVRAEDRPGLVDAVKELAENGFRVLATPGTAVDFGERGISTETVPKVGHGHPDTVERIEAGEVDLVINTTGQNPVSVRDSASIRRSALLRGVPYFTTLAGARAAVGAIRALRLQSIGVRALQDIHTA